MNKAECIAAGVDPAKVAKHLSALEKLMNAMAKDNIMLFGGGDGSSLRPMRGSKDQELLILAGVSATNIDGGAGGYGDNFSDDGLLRGES